MDFKKISELKNADNEIQNLIESTARKNNLINENIAPIYDGIYDAEKYLNSRIKILWVLKEPYDDKDEENNPLGGDWSISKDLFGSPENWYNNQTGKMVEKITYSILNGVDFTEIPDAWNNNNVLEAIQKVAYINLSKMPAFSSTDDNSLWSKYEIWKEVLWKQIETYNPEVIIFGNTFKYFQKDFENKGSLSKSEGLKWYFDDQLIIDAYHPCRKDDSYAEEIIASVASEYEKWQNNKDKQSSISKYLLLEKLSDFLFQNNLYMTISELATFLNTNNYKTSYGSEYAGGRGTYRLISSSYYYFESLNKTEVYKRISERFIKDDGYPAWW